MTHSSKLLAPEGAGGPGAHAPFPASKASGQDRIRRQLMILAVDDEPSLLRTYVRILMREGHLCQTAPGGKEALERYAAGKPDLVISDFNMPYMNGLELFRELKKIDPQVRMILISGEITPEEKETSLAEGVKAVLRKPYDIMELPAAIERFGF